MADVFAFACRVAWAPEWGETIINATSAGRAKREHLCNVSDPWPDTKFTDIRVRKVGAPYTSDAFKRNAEYRGMPDIRCGERVRVGDRMGTIVGHNSSANFEVLFDSGWRLNVHPSEIVRGESTSDSANP